MTRWCILFAHAKEKSAIFLLAIGKPLNVKQIDAVSLETRLMVLIMPGPPNLSSGATA